MKTSPALLLYVISMLLTTATSPRLLAENDEAAEALLTAATDLYKNKGPAEAVEKHREYLKKFPKGDKRCLVNYRLGEGLLKSGKEDEAIKAYEAATKVSPPGRTAAAASYRIASLYYNKKEFEKAVTHFEAAVGSDHNRIQQSARYYKARALTLSKKPKDAIKAYEEVIERSGKENLYQDSSRLGIARLHIELKQPEKAREHLEELLASDQFKEEAEKLIDSLPAEPGK